MLIPLNAQAMDADISRPDPARVIAGDPVHSTWNHYEQAGLYCGIWHSTAGAWRVQYDEWEYVNITAGYSILRGDDGIVQHLRAGARCIIAPGFRGVWEVVEPTTKDYVIQTFAPPAG